MFVQITVALNYMVRMSSDLETYLVAVERVNEYKQCPVEVEYNIARTIQKIICTFTLNSTTL